MTQKEIHLLLQDLSSRLRYGVQLYVPDYLMPYKLLGIDGDVLHIDTPVYDEGDGLFELDCFDIKPYLRPLSSMTEEEKEDYKDLLYCVKYGVNTATYLTLFAVNMLTDWFNAHHFDFRGLIEKGLALEAPEGMYNS